MRKKNSGLEYLLVIAAFSMSVVSFVPNVFSAKAIEYGLVAQLQCVVIINALTGLGPGISQKFGQFPAETIAKDKDAPTVIFYSPPNGLEYKGPVMMDIMTKDQTTIVNKIEIDKGNGNIQTYKDVFKLKEEWDPRQFPDGDYQVTVTAYDLAGNIGKGVRTMKARSGSLDVTPPELSIASPTNGATVMGRVYIQVNATDNVGVEQIEIPLPTGETAYPLKRLPYEWYWDSTQIADGDYSITARAKDKAGNSKETTVKITVRNPKIEAPAPEPQGKVENPPPMDAGDTMAPLVSIVTPTEGQTVRGNIMITINASDDKGLEKVTVTAGNSPAVVLTDMPYQTEWDTTRAEDNLPQTITVIARDKSGKECTAQTHVRVQNHQDGGPDSYVDPVNK